MIVRAEIENFGPFRGSHHLDLGEGTFAIVGHREGDELSSNWVGKTTLLEALGLFPLFGEQSLSKTEDGWISEGADAGGVLLVLVLGGIEVHIERSRLRGHPTLLLLNVFDTGTDAPTVLRGDAAQERIEQLLCLSKADFLNTRHFRQKQMSRFVTSSPSDRQAIVSDWLQLEPLTEAYRAAQRYFAQAIEAKRTHDMGRALIEGKRDAFLLPEVRGQAWTLDAVLGMTETKMMQAEESIAAFQMVLVSMRDREQQWASHDALVRDWKKRRDRHVSAVASGSAVANQIEETQRKLAALPATAQPDAMTLSELHASAVAASARLKKARLLASGSFDGACPVSPGFRCPATAAINERREANEKELREAVAEEERAAEKRSKAKRESDEWASKNAERARMQLELARLREIPNVVGEFSEPEPTPPECVRPDPADLEEQEGRIASATSTKREMERMGAGLRESSAELGKAIAAGKLLDAEVEATRAAVQVHRKALRLIAERDLLVIESGANQHLIDAGISLSVRIRWERETAQLATNCDGCGMPFPSSKMVKRCDRCGTERGPKMNEKLMLELSNVSGAANDIAGIMLQLSASEWLRERRASPFVAMYMDEPFGSVDPANARALASYFGAKAGHEQLFVISHSKTTTDALPRRVTVIGDGEGSSRVEVS